MGEVGRFEGRIRFQVANCVEHYEIELSPKTANQFRALGLFDRLQVWNLLKLFRIRRIPEPDYVEFYELGWAVSVTIVGSCAVAHIVHHDKRKVRIATINPADGQPSWIQLGCPAQRIAQNSNGGRCSPPIIIFSRRSSAPRSRISSTDCTPMSRIARSRSDLRISKARVRPA